MVPTLTPILELGLVQTGWNPESDDFFGRHAQTLGINFIDAIPSKYPDSQALKIAAQRWVDAGVRVRATQGFFFGTGVLICGCSLHSSSLVERTKVAAADARILNATNLILGAPSARQVNSVCSFEGFLEGLRLMVEICDLESKTLLLENLPKLLRRSHLASVQEILDGVQILPTKLGFCLDLGNSFSMRGNAAEDILKVSNSGLETRRVEMQLNASSLTPQDFENLLIELGGSGAVTQPISLEAGLASPEELVAQFTAFGSALRK